MAKLIVIFKVIRISQIDSDTKIEDDDAKMKRTFNQMVICIMIID